MNKSNFQILSEELEQEVSNLLKESKIKQELLEKSIDPSVSAFEYVDTINPIAPNTGNISGFAVGPAANIGAVVVNPNVLAAAKGKILPDADKRASLTKFKPLTSNNLATMMGFGVDDVTFQRAKDFIKMYHPDHNSTVAEKDDPEQDVTVDWKELNRAVSHFNSVKIKSVLSQSGLFNGSATNPYTPGLSSEYQNFNVNDNAQRIVANTISHILGKLPPFKGNQISGYVRKLSQNQKRRMEDTWNREPDQSGKIKLRNRKIVNEAFTQDLITDIQPTNRASPVKYMNSDLMSSRQVPQIEKKPKTNQYKANADLNRVNFNGPNIETTTQQPFTTAMGMQNLPPGYGPNGYHRADFNRDGVVSADDMGELLGAWGSQDSRFDINGDGVVSADDMGELLGAWGEHPFVDPNDGAASTDTNQTSDQDNIPYWMSGKSTNVDSGFRSMQRRRKK
jgi:hypothetical protein